MKLTLKNIGLIRNSEIQIDGLTVITGHNNSGKTTVGKSLYACIEGISNIDEKYNRNKKNYIERLNRHFILTAFDIVDNLKSYSRKKLTKKYSDKIKELIVYINNILNSHKISEEEISNFINFLEINENLNLIKEESSELSSYIKYIISSTKKILNDIQKINFYNSTEFAKDSLNSMLNIEFSNQIQPVKNKNKSLISEISITDNQKTDILHVYIKNNKVVNDKSFCNNQFEFTNIFLIDNPFVIDELNNFFGIDESDNSFVQFTKEEFFLSKPIYIKRKNNYSNNATLQHNGKLKYALSTDMYEKDIFEKGLNKKSYKNISKLLNNTIPGNVQKKKEKYGFEYVDENYSLNLSNLATGTKLFAIIKTLIDKGIIDKNTILILDEPESHLHPEWQNIFANLLVLLVKDLNCHILLTTHSPNFLLAIEAYMYKYNIVEKCNFYQTKYSEDKEYIEYQLTNNTDEIYKEFVKFLSEVKDIRNNYTKYHDEYENE